MWDIQLWRKVHWNAHIFSLLMSFFFLLLLAFIYNLSPTYIRLLRHLTDISMTVCLETFHGVLILSSTRALYLFTVQTLLDERPSIHASDQCSAGFEHVWVSSFQSNIRL